MTLQIRLPSSRCMCWLTNGKHTLTRDRLSGRLICVHCGKDGDDAMSASNDFQHAWTEYHDEDFLREERAQGTVLGQLKLLIPRRIKEAMTRG